jgi:sulfite exporter TauE/SafE
MLPCGLVYFALAASVGAGGLLEGILYMILFGLGTIPLLLVVITLKTQERIISGKIFKKIIPLFSLTLAILLITRGLNLGLPYLSPKISEKTQKIEIKCCSKANSKSP